MLMRTLVGPSLSPSNLSDTSFISHRPSPQFSLRLMILSGLLLHLTLHQQKQKLL